MITALVLGWFAVIILSCYGAVWALKKTNLY